MNDVDIVKINALRYLGYNKASISKADSETLKALEKAAEEIEKLNSFKFVHKVFDITINADIVIIRNSDISFKSSSLSKFLEGVERAAFFAATLGTAVDRLIATLSHSSMEKAVIYDAVSSAIIEYKCDKAQKSIVEDEMYNCAKITRFSPGYADFSLRYNEVIINLLNAQKSIGLTCTQYHLFVPKKSIAAIFGLSNRYNAYAGRKCEKCGLADNCLYKDQEI